MDGHLTFYGQYHPKDRTMCGIAGIFNFNQAPVSADKIEVILNKLQHRGRDHQQIMLGHEHQLSAGIGLGHRRLSIIDLNPLADQPMFYANNQLCLIYNGEIYNYLELRQFLTQKNYHFKTKSDTEVLLAAYDYWGENCLTHLNGMFAFALWDERNKHLFCARDHLGIKPFYYLLTPHFFAFASEAQALNHLVHYDLNQDAIYYFLLSMYLPHTESAFSAIQKLSPAHALMIHEKGEVKKQRFWQINTFETINQEASVHEQLHLLLNKSIKQQLQSDVPVGSFLSGGIDSGLITAMAASQVKQFHTYSVGYEGMRDNELPHARLIAERYSTQHTELTITAQDAMHYLDKALSCMSEPIADPASVATYMLAELAAQDGVKVLLNGTGGDEVFAGYTRYSGQLSLKRKLLLAAPKLIKTCLQFLPLPLKTKWRIKHVSLDMLLSTGGSYALVKQLSASRKWLISLLDKLAQPFNFINTAEIPLLYKQMLFDLHAYVPEELLFLLDQMTMAHTIEGRVPLLDIDVIQFAFQLNAKWHMKNGQTKAILKQIALPYLGHEHITRKKQGFAGSTPWWVQHHYHQFIDVIAGIKQIPFFNDFNIDTFRKNGNANDMFLLYCLSKWYDNIRK
jgi:asparagine synthase (glutamine-hydrolysing)